MDDGGRCLLDVINDPNLLRSFLEGGSEKVQEILTQRNVWQCQTLTGVPELELNTQNVHYTALSNALDQQEISCSDAVLESAHLRQDQISSANHFNSTILVSEPSSEQLGYTCHIDNAGILGQSTSVGLSTIASSPATISSYHTPSPAGTTVHHIPSPAHPQPSPATPRSLTPLSHAVRSPSQGPPSVQSVHSMPPPSPLQQTRSPLPPHTPSPAPAWSPVSYVQTNVTGRCQTAAHNQILQTSNNVTQVVQAMSPQLAQKLQLQQQVILQHQAQQPRLSVPSSSVIPSTANVPMAAPPVVQIIPAPQQTSAVSSRNQQSSVRPIQPKQPQQILPKPVGTPSNQFATPVVKQVGTPTVATNQRTVGMGLNAGQMVIGQGQPGVFAGTQGTFVLNQLISPVGVGQSPILIHGNIPGVQFTLRPQHSSLTTSASSGQPQSSAQNNAALIAALQAQSQTAQTLFTQTKASLPGQQTIVIPSSITHTGLTAQNLNLAAAGTQSVNSTVVPSGPQSQGLLSRQNIILTPRLMGPNQGIQFQQIQTPQGPLTVAIGHGQHISLPQLPALQNTALGGPHLNAATIPVSGVMPAGQGVISSLSLQPTPNSASLPLQQQALSGANVAFHSQKEQSSVQVASVSSSNSSSTHTTSQAAIVTETSSTTTTKQVPTVNLADILKQHGIVPETTPSPSPISSPQPDLSMATTEDIGQLGAIDITKQTSLAEVLHSSPQVMTVAQPNQTVPQVKLTLAHDGSVILQSHPMPTSGIPQGQAQSLEVQTSTVTVAPYISSSTSSSDFVTSTSQAHSALLARLNAAPAVDVMTSLGLAGSICTPTTVTSTVATTPTISPLIPLTVQNISDGIVPINSTRLSQPVTTTSSEETIFQESCIPVVNSGSSTDNSTRINHVIVGLQVGSSQSGSLTTVNTTQATHMVSSSSTETISDNSGIVSAIGTMPSGSVSTKVVQHDVSQGLPTSNISTIQTTVVPNQNIQLSVPNQQVEIESGKLQQSQVHLQPVATSVVSAQTQPNTVTGQNVHLVNLLKQGPVQSIPLRVIAPVPGSVSSSTSETINTVTNITVPTQVRVGNQILTLAPHQRHAIQGVQNPFRSLTDQQQFPQTQQVVLRIQQNQQLQQQQQSSVSTVTVPGVIQIQNKLGVSRLPLGIPVSKSNRLQQQLRRDHNAVIHPDYKQPFESIDDACQRLLPFHVFNTPVHQEEELIKTDMMFEAISIKCLKRIQRMKHKYQLLLLKESMKYFPTPERVMLERMFIQEETEALKEDKKLVEEGKSLDLPPLPESWNKMINPSIKVENCVKKESSVEDNTQEECTVKKVLKSQEYKGISVKRKSVEEETNDICNRHITRLTKIVKRSEENICNNRIKPEVFTEILQKSSPECSPFPSHNNKVHEEIKDIDDCKDEDIVTTLRRELNMSPIEDDEPDVGQVDFETADGTGGLADFEPPVARTEDNSVVSSYANGSRTAVKMKYDFNVISNTAEWISDYTNHDRKVISESEAAVESILEGQEEDSNLDLSSIGLDESLERQEVLYNGIEESNDSYVNYSQYENPKLRTLKEREKHSKVDIRSDHSTNELEQSAQVQSAIKSILELQQPENHSYFTDEEENFTSPVYSLERHENHQSAMDYEVSLDADIEIASSESDAVLDEAVRSILLNN